MAGAANFPFFIKIKGVDEISGMLGSVQMKIQNVGKSLTRLGQDLSLKVSAPLAAFGGYAVQQAGKVEQLQIAFGTLLGSAEAGKSTLQDLLQFTAATPFELEGVAEAARSLLVSGVAAKDLIPTLSTIGDVAAGVGGRLEDVALPYWQILQLGKAQLVDLKQLSTQGVPIIKQLANTYGVTTETILEAVSAGEISAQMFTDAFKSLTTEGSLFFQASQKQSMSIFGLFSTLKDSVMIAMAEFGSEIVRALDVNQLIKDLTGLVGGLVKAFAALPAPVKEFAIKLGVIAALVGPVITGLGFIAFSISSLISLYGTLAGLFAAGTVGAQIITMLGNWVQLAGFIAASNPVILGVIAAIIVGFKYLGSFIKGVVDGIKAGFTALFGDSMTRLVGNLSTSVRILANAFMAVWNAITSNEIVIGIFYELGKAIATIVGGPLLIMLRMVVAIVDKFSQLFNFIGKAAGLDFDPNYYKPVEYNPSVNFNPGAVDFSNQPLSNNNTVSQVEVIVSAPDGTVVQTKKGTGLKGVKVGKTMPGV